MFQKDIPAKNLAGFETLLHDPMVRSMMDADRVTKEDLLTALRVAYNAISRERR